VTQYNCTVNIGVQAKFDYMVGYIKPDGSPTIYNVQYNATLQFNLDSQTGQIVVQAGSGSNLNNNTQDHSLSLKVDKAWNIDNNSVGPHTVEVPVAAGWGVGGTFSFTAGIGGLGVGINFTQNTTWGQYDEFDAVAVLKAKKGSAP
jgi:hypothetical protein